MAEGAHGAVGTFYALGQNGSSGHETLSEIRCSYPAIRLSEFASHRAADDEADGPVGTRNNEQQHQIRQFTSSANARVWLCA